MTDKIIVIGADSLKLLGVETNFVVKKLSLGDISKRDHIGVWHEAENN